MAQSITNTAEKEGIMYVSGSAATSFLPYVGQAKYLKLLKGEKSKNKANGIRSAITQKTTESLQRIGSKKENSLWPNGIKNSGKQYVQEVTHFFRQTFMPNPSFQLSTANQAPINVWSRATIENRMDSIVPVSLRKVEGKGTTKGTGNVKHLDDVPRIKKIEVNFNRNVKHDPEEFTRQLKDQEKGMNELTVDEYLKNREKYIEQGRAIEGNAAQQAAREEAYVQKINELQREGLTLSKAKKHAKEWLDTQAALHNPDQIAGGKAEVIGGLGDKRINSSIGSQWRYRIDIVDEQIKELAKSMTPEQLKNTYLNVKLTH